MGVSCHSDAPSLMAGSSRATAVITLRWRGEQKEGRWRMLTIVLLATMSLTSRVAILAQALATLICLTRPPAPETTGGVRMRSQMANDSKDSSRVVAVLRLLRPGGARAPTVQSMGPCRTAWRKKGGSSEIQLHSKESHMQLQLNFTLL